MLLINHINEEILSKKYEIGKISKKGKEYHYIYGLKEEEIDGETTDIYYAVRLMPLSSDLKDDRSEADIRYSFGAYRFQMKKKGSATIKKKEQLQGDEWSTYANAMLTSFIACLSENKKNIDTTFDYGIFEIATVYMEKLSIAISSNIQTATVWNEFTVTADINSLRNEDWVVESKSNFKTVKSLLI